MRRILLIFAILWIAAGLVALPAQAEPSGNTLSVVQTWTNDWITVKAFQVTTWDIERIYAHLELYNASTQTNYVVDSWPSECGVYYDTNTVVCIIPRDFMHQDWYLITYLEMEVPSAIYVEHEDSTVQVYSFSGAPEPIRRDFTIKTYLPTLRKPQPISGDPYPPPAP